ncbi:MAG: MoaD/ThiS family protein [Methanosarcinaceae archaeon]
MSIRVDIKILAGGTSKQTIEVKIGTTYEHLLDMLDINQETVIVLKDGQAVPLDGTVMSGDLTILKIVSGG